MTLNNGVQTGTEGRGALTIEGAIDAMPRLGLTRVGWLVLLVAFFLSTYENAIVAIALPSMARGLGVSPGNLALAVSLNLVGLAIGSYVIGYLADRFGRQFGIRLAFGVLGLGSLASAFAWDVASLTVIRFIAGCGMGAVIALVTAYIGEISPQKHRGAVLARIAVIATILIVIASLGAVPVNAALPQTAWRIMFSVGTVALLLLLAVNKRDVVESPRWLVENNGLARAATIVRAMERRARGPVTPDAVEFIEPAELTNAATSPFRTLFTSRMLVGRLAMMVVVWFLFYIGFFGINTYLPQFLEGTGIKETLALTITASSRIASLVAAIVIVFVIDRFERKYLIIAGFATIALGTVLVISGLGVVAATVGSVLMAFGTGGIAPTAFIYTAEIFPTNVRATGTSIADGVGSLGGAVTPFLVLPLLLAFGPLAGGGAVIGVITIAAIVVAFGVRTKGRTLEEIAR